MGSSMAGALEYAADIEVQVSDVDPELYKASAG